MVRLKGAVGDHDTAPLGGCIGQEKFQLADLVPSIRSEAGKVVPFDIDLAAKLLREALQPVEELAEFGDVLFLAKLLMMEFSLRSRSNGEEIEISEYEAHTLMAIKHSPNITSTELAGLLGKTKSTLSPLIFKLYSLGYITKEVNPKNRREHLLNITPLGEQVCERHHALDAELMRISLMQILKYCTLEEFDAFMKVTRIRNDIFSKLRSDVHKRETVMWGC